MQFDSESLALVLRVLVAIILGAAIGLERQLRSPMAGMRTNTLVAGGAALFVVLGGYSFGSAIADPTRVAAQVVTGIGFLGAGVIMREGLNVRGLNTAATLWCSAAVGSLAGAGLYLIAVSGTIGVLGTNTVLRPITRLISRRRRWSGPETQTFVCEVIARAKSEQIVRGVLLQHFANAGLPLQALSASRTRGESVALRVELQASSGQQIDVLQPIMQRLSLDPKVRSVRCWDGSADDDGDG